MAAVAAGGSAPLAAKPGSPGIALGGVPLPEAEEAIFTEFLKETERRRVVHIHVLYTVRVVAV